VAPPPYERSVFINCPYDVEFAPLFHAIVLTVAARGFTPRSALETGGSADPRIVRIVKGLMSSKYSIHDLSRFQGEGVENLSRFNMPLELGMALAIRFMKDGTGTEHKLACSAASWRRASEVRVGPGRLRPEGPRQPGVDGDQEGGRLADRTG
jgi:hypothetical protein